MTSAPYDLTVIGAGIVGLATAHELLQRRPGLRVAIVDKEDAIAFHQSGRNSGVIHAGSTTRRARCAAGSAARGGSC